MIWTPPRPTACRRLRYIRLSLYSLARPLLFALDPEVAHNVTLAALANPLVARSFATTFPTVHDPRLRQQAFAMTFANPVGLAAGLDKQGTAVGAWDALGFGAAEIGTVTPRPQSGNPRPRLFRLPEDEALVNRFGFNSAGASGVAGNLEAGARRHVLRLGINLGKNKDTPNDRAVDDYLAVLERLWVQADYVVVNVSSPNTEGLRDLQQGHYLRGLVAQVVAMARTAGPTPVPVLVKLSPDMDDRDLLDAVDASLEGGAAGLIATNTTTSRSGLSSSVSEAGGLSGRPLRARATSVCRAIFTHVGGQVPIVGVGGIDSADAAYERIRAGATLVQIYTGLIYQGPALVHDILRGLLRLLDRDGLRNLHEAIGIDAR